MKLLVAAVPGAGKTTVLEFVKRKFKAAKIVGTGDLVFEYAKRHYGMKNRDETRKMTMKQQRAAQENAAKKIGRMRDRVILIDTHLSIKTPTGYIPGGGTHMLRHIRPDGIVLLEFRPEDVLARRKKDRSRHRDKETKEEIETQQHVNQEIAFAISNEFDIPVDIVNLRHRQRKEFDHATKAAGEVVKIIKRMQK